MSVFTDRVADVYVLTNRPDLTTDTEAAVKAATLRAHRLDFFDKDLHETGISFPSSAYIQSLDYSTLLPRWRSLKYLRKYDSVNSKAGGFLKVLTPEQTLDRYNVEKTDIMYLAGLVYQIKSSTLEQYFLLGCYLNPDVAASTYSSWIANEYPNAIVYDAASIVCKGIELDALATKYETMRNEERAELIMSNIVTVGS